MRQLNIFYEQKLVGTLFEDDEERLEFKYTQEWIENSNSFSLSLALNINKESYGHLITKSFFENLLPEGEVKKILEKQSTEYIGDEFSFLQKYGADCAGAFIISPLDKISTPEKDNSKLIDLEKIYHYLDHKQSLTNAMINNEGGRFSLAGAQDKFPIIYTNKKIYLPLSGQPTTHILKPYVSYLKGAEDSPYNEYFCMRLAAACKLDVPHVDLIPGRFPLYLIERFDRTTSSKGIVRVHEEDFCQAQGLTSRKKYEGDGGPTIAKNYNLIKENSALPVKDLSRFIEWMWFNLLIGNHDCHSKNLSFIHTDDGIRLSPFYDILCTTIYPGLTNNFSFTIGKQSQWFKLKDRHFDKLGEELQISSNLLCKLGRETIKKVETQLEKQLLNFNQRFPDVLTGEKIYKEIKKRIAHLKKNITHLKA